MAGTKTATLTHKVRNPQNLDEWLDIWEAKVSAEYDESNNRSNEVVTITPSNNWKIPTDKGITTDENNKVIHSNNITGGTVGSSENTTGSSLSIPYITYDNQGHITAAGMHTHNITISSEIQMENTATEGQDPNNQNVIIRTNENGYLIPGPIIDSNNGSSIKFLNEKGEWVNSNYILSASKINNIVHITLKENGDPNYHGYIKFTSNEGISIDSTVNNQINIVANTNAKDQAGIVTAGDGNNQKAWATDNNGNPAWRTGQVTVKKQNIILVKDATNFIKGFYSTPLTSEYALSSYEYLQGASYLIQISENTTPTDYKIVFRDEMALASSSNETNPRTRLEITETDVVKDVIYSS